ncbi:hypothetical protein [Vallitalea maricola]|uniref:Uncharacterized protein n=1 Tax=Vallitalea maricola TaxID=3074433 RepID=A0ACB5UNP7_9FIRM|nr:hypothetical protein AN2V17_27570 [Vallitalea sp. AN17-2]
MKELISRLNESEKFEVAREAGDYDESLHDRIILSSKNSNKPELIIRRAHLDFYKDFDFDELELLDDFLGFIWKTDIYLQVTSVSRINRSLSPEKNLNINMNYKNNNLDILIKVIEEGQDEYTLMSSIRGGRYRPSRATIVKISNFTTYDESIFSEDIRCITDSVLFDISSNFRIHFEPISLDDYYTRPIGGMARRHELPNNSIEFSYKDYIPELIGYYRNAEKVNYIPFRYLCYYSIIEYFLDKSAYYQVSSGIRKMLLKPDFHLRIDHYVNKAVKLVKKENEKHLTDKIKLKRVFNQYIDREELAENLDEINRLSYFTEDRILKCNSDMRLIGINFENDNAFYDNLTTRIYRLRCSIVHSNPDFDEDKAIPFLATNENLALVRKEILLIEMIAKIIIINSAI